MSKIDKIASTLSVDDAGMMRMDAVVLFRLVQWNGELWVQTKDRNRQRCALRGDDCVMVPLDLFIAKLVKVAQRSGNG